MCERWVGSAGDGTEFAPRLPTGGTWLAGKSHLVHVPGGAYPLGGTSHLLFESAVDRSAPRTGGSLWGVCDLGVLVFPATTYVRAGDLAVSCRSRMVAIDPAVARSGVAAGGCGGFAGIHRRRPRAHHRRPQFRLPQQK